MSGTRPGGGEPGSTPTPERGGGAEPAPAARHAVVVDLSFGDAGKGTTVAHLCARAAAADRPVAAVVRFNGGAQAGHNVVTDDGRHHTFAQFGSGTLTAAPVPTHLSRFHLVDPLALAGEARHLAALGVPDPLGLVTVHADALVATPFHAAANRARERARGADRHGSCGMGVGETAAYALAHPAHALRVADCGNPHRLHRLLTRLRDHLRDALDEPARRDLPSVEDLADAYSAFAAAVPVVGDAYLAGLLRRGRVVLEGAQGVLLDETHGFDPYTTWSTTTFANAEELLGGSDALHLGVLRTYTTRHGPGPLPTEGTLPAVPPEPHNGTGRWQGAFRAGVFDAVLHRYAVRVAGRVDGLVLTHLDTALRERPGMCDAYLLDGRRMTDLPPVKSGGELTSLLEGVSPIVTRVAEPGKWPYLAEKALGRPVMMVSNGPGTMGDKDAHRHLLFSNIGSCER